MLDELRRRVLQNPQDTDALSVWADALLEAGDEWGDLISLQLAAEARALNAKEQKRARQLIKTHYRKWLGATAGVIDGAVFTDTEPKGSFDSQWATLLEGLPELASLSFRQRGTWQPQNVASLEALTRRFEDVTLPRARKATRQSF